ncbi:hypothetical protein [Streptomyces sp. NPDC088183]|uniref:hypothetical protein n=1 Tax=Streptomyces sp. NPDC088183 TaxID=3160992 RepID=UPI0034482380
MGLVKAVHGWVEVPASRYHKQARATERTWGVTGYQITAQGRDARNTEASRRGEGPRPMGAAPVVDVKPIPTLTAGTRVGSLTTGRLGTVNEAAGGTVTLPGHANFGRAYVDVNWDSADEDKGLHRRSRPFVDELDVVGPAPDVAPTQCIHGNTPRPNVTGDPIEACRSARGVKDFGVFNDEGCIYVYGCAVDVANEAVKECAESDYITWSKLCTEHEEQPAGTCEKCHADEDDDPDA